MPDEKRRWKIEHEPRRYEYEPFPPAEPNVDALLAVSLFLLLKHLQEKDRSVIEMPWSLSFDWQNTNAPESPPQNEDSEA